MEIRKLHESNELQDRAKKHKKNNKGLSFYCTLNPDAGNVEHNVAMFNHMNTPAEGPSVNPCGPMAEAIDTTDLQEEVQMDKFIDLHYDDLEVTTVTRPQRPSSYHFEYDRDEAQTVEEKVSHDYSVPRSDVVDFIYENMTENDFADIDTASEDEIVAFINKNFDQLFDKYESMILDYYRDDAREDAERTMRDSMYEELVESVTPAVEDFLIDLGQTQDVEIYQMYLRKDVDDAVNDRLRKLRTSYNRYADLDNEERMSIIVGKVKELLRACPDKVYEDLPAANMYIIMAVMNDGKKQYYNVSSAPHWVDNGKDATIFDDMDEARAVWFKIDKKPFKRVFIPNYDYETMNEALAAVDVDKQYAIDTLQDSIDDLMDRGLRGYKTRYVGNHVYRVEHRTGNTSVLVKFDVKDPSKKLVFLIDKQGPYIATTEKDAAKLIIDAVNNKHSKSFDMFGEDLSDRIRKNDLEFDDSIDAWHAEEDGTEIQLQDRESHTHEFRTAENQWGRSYVAGQYNKQPKVASSTWGRVWKDGDLVKQFEGPKYQVRADMAKYLDADGKLDEAKIPDNWTQYNGAWMYPVSDGWEANLDGLHYEAETEDELKAKIDRAVSGGWTKDKKLKQYFKEGAIRYQVIVDAVTPNYVVSEHEFLRDAIDAAREEIDLNWASNVRIKDLSDGACWHDIENAEADLRDGIVIEAWSPELVDCPVCGDISFDSRKGRCTQCSYRESLDEFSDELDHPDQEFDSAKTSINSTKLPAVYKMVKIPQGTTGVDFGGGSFDNAVEHIRDLGATLCVYDPYNRSAEHNSEVIKTLKSNGGADWAINSNVLNVIKEPEARKAVLKNISRITKSDAPVYITVYEGRGDGQEGATKSGYQLNRKTQDYLAEIQEVFPDAVRRGKLIVAHNGRGKVNESNNAYSYKDCTIIDVGSGWKVKDASQNWVGNEFATDTDAEEFVDSLHESFLDSDDNYEFISSKSVLDSDGFYTDYTWYKNQDGLNVFVFGDNDLYKPADGYIDHEEEDDTAAQEWFDNYNGFEEDIVDEALNETVKYPNGSPVSEMDLKRALDYMYGTDRNPEWTYTDAEMQRAVNRWMDKIDPRPDGKSYNDLTESYNIKFFQIFEAPKKPTENGKMIGQRDSLSAAIDFGEDRCGKGNFFIKGVCDDGRTRYVDFYRKDRGYTPLAKYQDDVSESYSDWDEDSDNPVYVASSIDSLNNYCTGLGDACKKLRDGNVCSYRGYEVEFIDGEYNVYLLESIDESKENRPLYVIKDSHGNQLSAPNPDDEELWDRVASMEARGRRGLCVVAYTGKKESLKEWNEFSDDDVEDELTHAAVYGGDSKYCKECGAVKKYDEDGFAYCPECCGETNSIVESTEDGGKTVSVSFDVDVPEDMTESQLEDLIRNALKPTDAFINSYMEVHTLDESLNEKLTGYKLTVKQGEKTFDDYACSYDEAGAIQQMKNKYGNDIEIVNVDGSRVIRESYWYNDPELRQKQYDLIAELEADGFEETDGQSHGTKHWTFFRKRVDGKGVWKAIFVDTGSKEAAIIDVTYGQVRGYEPLDSIDALRKGLGRALLPN